MAFLYETSSTSSHDTCDTYAIFSSREVSLLSFTGGTPTGVARGEGYDELINTKFFVLQRVEIRRTRSHEFFPRPALLRRVYNNQATVNEPRTGAITRSAVSIQQLLHHLGCQNREGDTYGGSRDSTIEHLLSHTRGRCRESGERRVTEDLVVFNYEGHTSLFSRGTRPLVEGREEGRPE